MKRAPDVLAVNLGLRSHCEKLWERYYMVNPKNK